MGKKLVLAEKPSVGRDIARVLKCTKKGNGYLEGDQYIVTWALGHLVTLADPESYDHKYKAWKLEDLPMLPKPLKLVVIPKTGKQFQAVKSQLNRKDVSEIVIATDAGREGELVARWILEKANTKKPVKRLWISSVTDKAIKDGFKHLKSGKDYENLYASAVARSEADWIVGINGTRALTSKFNAQLSCGRVQTPTLAMIEKRDEDIRSFVPKEYYRIEADTNLGIKLLWSENKTNQTRIFSREKSEKIVAALQNKTGEIIDIHKSDKKKFAPQLYDLTELQRDAHNRYGFSAKETLSIMQKLYEHHKLVTYPRTDSRYLSQDIVETLKDRVKAVSNRETSKVTNQILARPIRANKSFVDDSKVSDHHAIIPTEQAAYTGALSDKEHKIYDLIVKRFLSVLMPPFEYEQTSITAKVGSEIFKAKGKVIKSQGWKALYQDVNHEEDGEDMKEQTLPSLRKGDSFQVKHVYATQGYTNPPARFTEATLLTAMENPAAFMAGENKALIKTIGETGGLGTVATRADIIEKLFNSFLIEKRGKDIYITQKGKQLLELVPEDLRSPALTAEWEQKLSQIAKGTLSKDRFVSEMREYAITVVRDIKFSDKKFKHDNLTGSRCPECNQLMLEVNGKRGKMLVCQDRACGYRKHISQTTNARCPNCHKKLELRGEGEGQIFVCSCGHREKMSHFKERRSKQKNQNVSKREVQNYMKKQNKEEEPLNNPFAEALAKLKLKE